MSANIFGTRFAGHRKPAWHEIGTVFEEVLTASEAFKLADMGYEVTKIPLVPQGHEDVETGIVGIFRLPTADDPEHVLFGTASGKYPIMSNEDLATLLDPISEKWPVETVGALNRGKTVFTSLQAGSIGIGPKGKQDELKQFFLVSDTRDGKHSLTAAFTPIRVVCQNTLTMGERAASVTIKVPHLEGFEADTKVAVELMSAMGKSQSASLDAMNLLAKTKATKAKIAQIFEAAYPTPKPPSQVRLADGITPDDLGAKAYTAMLARFKESRERWEYYVGRAESMREHAQARYDVFGETSKLGGTVWAAYNAVVEVEDFRRGSNAPLSAVFGPRATTKKRAFEAAIAAS
jgi:phage/plasmid-like protein (TIGR03299 family)